MASQASQPRKRARTTRASRRAQAFELLGDGAARVSLSLSDAHKSPTLADKTTFTLEGQGQASLDIVQAFLTGSNDILTFADADTSLRVCEAGAALALPALVSLSVERLRALQAAPSPPTSRRRVARGIQERDNSRLIDTANAPIFGIDRDGRVDVWNQCAARLTGFAEDEVAGKRLVEKYITGEYKERVQDVFTKALAGEETANFEFPLVTKGGVVLQILLNATTRRDDRERVVGVVGIGQDITARINQEQEYARLIDAANAPIFGIDVQGNVNVWNQCAIRLTGFDADEVMGKHLVDDYITTELKDSVQDVFTKALHGDETANFEFPLVTKAGTRVEVLLNATTRRDEKNRVIGVVGIGQDITARINQEQEYGRLIDAANAPIFGIDVQGSVNVWNQCAIRLTGFDAEEVMGKRLVNEFITDDYKASVQDVFTKALEGTETANFEFPLVTKVGTRVQVLLNATTRRDEKNKVIGVVGIGQDITARMAQEQEYARLIDTANAPIFGIGVHGRVNVWNKSATNLTGFTSEDVMGRHLVNEFITDDFKERVQGVFRNALNGVETANFEFPLVTKAGTRVEVLLNATTRRDEQNHVIGVVGIGQDITARIAQEQEYSKLIDTANAPIFGVDRDGLVNVWNRNASDVTGFSADETMGKHLVNDFITDDYKASVQDVFTKALDGDETANFEFPLVTKVGTRVEVLLNATTRRDAKGRASGVVGIGQDITARIAKEQEYARLIDTANAPIFGIDLKGLVNVWNKNASDVTGFTSQDVMGRHLVDDFITEDHKERVQEVFTKALDGEEAANFEFPLVTKNGTRVEVLLNATTRRDDQGKATGVVGIGQDITARIAQEQEYFRLIDTANAPIFGIDANGLVNVWNKNATDLTGFAGEEVMGRNLVNDFITDDFKARVQEVFTKALAGVQTANFEFPLVTKLGVRVEVLLNATTRRDEHNRISGVVGIGQDITARIAQEQEYARLIDTANAPIFGIDADGLVNIWNKNASDVTGFTSQDVMGKHLVDEFITDDYKASVQDVFTKALEGLETANFEFPLVTKAGTRVEVLLNATSRRDEKNLVTGVVGIGQDITARIAQEEEYSRLIDTANAPIFGIDLNGLVNVWNRNASRLMGFAGEEVMGRNLVNEFITDDYKARVQDVFTKALEGRETANFELPLVTKANVSVRVLLNATTRRDDQGKATGVVGIGQDITARIAQEQEYARLIDTANAPIFGIDLDGRVNVWNQCASHLMGFETDDVMGTHLVNRFITDDYKVSVQNVLTKALVGVETSNFEFPLVTKDGARVQILLNATTRRDEKNRVIGVVGIGQDITARIAQEQEYSRLIETANAPIFGIDRDGRVNVWNTCASNLTGFGVTEVKGRHLVDDFITPDFKASVQDVFSKALTGVETANFEFPLVTKAGKTIEVLLNATTRRDERDLIIGVVGIGQDITARVAQEQEYARLIDTANAPIFGVDVNGLINVWNKNAATITEFSSAETKGKNLVKDFIREEHRDRVQDVFTKALAGDETANFEFPMTTKNNKRVEVLLNATTRRDEQGNVIGVVGIGQDITARIAQEQEYSRLIDSANAPIFGVDMNGDVNVWNVCSANLTGFPASETLGNSLVDNFITPQYRPMVAEVISRALRGIETANFEFPLMNKSSTKLISILLNATTRRDETGKVVGVVGIGQDISESRAKQDAILKQREAEAAQAAQATISAHVYHEIRNVVGAVLALAERVSETVELALLESAVTPKESTSSITAKQTKLSRKLPDAVRKLTEHQRVVCQHAVNTLNDMLDVAKIENGTYLPKEDVVDLGALCARAAELQGPRLQHAVELVVDAPKPGELVVLTDRVLLLQFMTNLLSNAAKFTSTGKVLIYCAALNRSSAGMADVCLAVADTGPGIAPAQQKRVLMAFTTGDAVPHEDLSDTATASRSTGIGLRLADLIANVLSLHGGPDVEVPEADLPKEKEDEKMEIDEVPKVDEVMSRTPSSLNLYEGTAQRRWWRALRTGIQLESPVEDDVKDILGHKGGPGTLLWLVTRMKRAPAGSVEDMGDEVDVSDTTRRLKLRGRMRVLVVDDQRTMRQMVATLFQRLCQENEGLEIEVDTAISGEHATRLARARRYHVVTMDQQLSESYCSAVVQERAKKRAAGTLKTDGVSTKDGFALSLTFGPDRIQNAQRRLAYFENEIDSQCPELNDGTMVGHEAVQVIRDDEVSAKRPPTICFNLTGNILEADRKQYSASGSSGVLPKPTKLADLRAALLNGVPQFLARGSCVQRGDAFFHAFGELQIAEMASPAVPTRSVRNLGGEA